MACDPVTGAPGVNTAAERFANAKLDTCGGASFGTGPNVAGHVFYADEFGVGVQFIQNGVSFTPAAKSLSCRGAQSIYSWSGSSIQASFPSSTPYNTNCLLTYTDANGYTVSHYFDASSVLLGGVLVGNLHASTVTTGWFERNRPTVLLTGLPSTIGDTPQWVTITFSEPVYGFGFTDVNVAFAFVLDFVAVSAREYRIQIKRGASAAPVSLSVPANGAADIVGNLNLASNTLTATVDVTPPTVTLSGLSGLVGTPFTVVTANFSEPVAGFAISDISGTNATISSLVSTGPSSYTFHISPVADGLMSVRIPAATLTDLAGLANTASNTLSATADATLPTVVFSGLPATIGAAPQQITATFSEDVFGLTLGDFFVANGALSNLQAQSAQVYTFDIRAAGGGPLGVQLPANTVVDGVGNSNLLSAVFGSLRQHGRFDRALGDTFGPASHGLYRHHLSGQRAFQRGGLGVWRGGPFCERGDTLQLHYGQLDRLQF